MATAAHSTRESSTSATTQPQRGAAGNAALSLPRHYCDKWCNNGHLIGNPLTVAELLEVNPHKQPPFLAYRSACGTGRIKDNELIDESIPLISACQLAGFRHVIGTLWEVVDEICVDMAYTTYDEIRAGEMTDDSVAWGLHVAMRQLRDRWLNDRGDAAYRKRNG
ncbi:hypothetical protein BDV10DRAFT_185693 [Aspergillus recurvatus]